MKLSLPALHLQPTSRATRAHASPVRSFLGRLVGLRAVLESHWVFTQDLISRPPRPIIQGGIRITTIDSPAHPEFPHMLAIAREQGLDGAWCLEQLAEGAVCTVALETGERDGIANSRTTGAVGMGMIRTAPFWIDEIRHHFTPGPSGCYLYGLYVSPAFRGRGIQHALGAARLQHALARRCRYVHSIVLNTNRASLKGHAARGAIPSARVDCLRLGSVHVASVRKLHPSLPSGSFTHGGFPRHASLHVIRAHGSGE